MKILKEGIIPSPSKRFICENCGCEWIAYKGEYIGSSQMEVMHDGLKPYKCNCPTCSCWAYAD